MYTERGGKSTNERYYDDNKGLQPVLQNEKGECIRKEVRRVRMRDNMMTTKAYNQYYRMKKVNVH